MILSGDIVRNAVSSALDPDVQKQPAGFDLTVGSIASLVGPAQLDFDNSERQIPSENPLKPDKNGWYSLPPGSFLVTYGEAIKIPNDAAGIVLPRSSLMRMGGTIVSALWDPGYEGRGKGLLILGHHARLKQRARIAQLVLFKTQDVTTGYSGSYQHEALNDTDFKE